MAARQRDGSASAVVVAVEETTDPRRVGGKRGATDSNHRETKHPKGRAISGRGIVARHCGLKIKPLSLPMKH